MRALGHLLVCLTLVACGFTKSYAAPLWGAKASGSDLEPSSAFLVDGGPGSRSAAVSFSTFQAEASLNAQSTYLPILRAKSEGLDATSSDDRTQAHAEAYEVFTSSIAQTIRLDIALDSLVTNAPTGTSGVLANIYVIGGPGFGVSDIFCSPGQYTFDGAYLCGIRIARSEIKPALNWSNLFNGGGAPSVADALTFTVGAGESFGIYANLSAGSFKGTADAFHTLSLSFADTNGIIAAAVPEPSSIWVAGTAGLALGGVARRKCRRSATPVVGEAP